MTYPTKRVVLENVYLAQYFTAHVRRNRTSLFVEWGKDEHRRDLPST